MRTIFVGLPACVLVVSITPVYAQNECQTIGNLVERIACVEQKADAAIATARDAAELAKKALTAASNPALPQNVQIRSSTRPGQCLTWVGAGAAAMTNNCEQPDIRWNMVK